jgi:hypothetical protein
LIGPQDTACSVSALPALAAGPNPFFKLSWRRLDAYQGMLMPLAYPSSRHQAGGSTDGDKGD